MFDKLYKQPAVAQRHWEGPALQERIAFLENCVSQGFHRSAIQHLAQSLLGVATYLDISQGRSVTRRQVQAAALRWSRRPPCGGWKPPSVASGRAFAILARRWCRFLGRLEVPTKPHQAYAAQLCAYTEYLREERGFSESTITARRQAATYLLDQFAVKGQSLKLLDVSDVDSLLIGLRGRGRGWCRVSVASAVGRLRPFLQYGADHGWWSHQLPDSLLRPHIHREEQLPIGPSWSDVERILASANGECIRDLRDAAILRLLAVYGLRASEVAGLSLDDIDWKRERLTVMRAKQRRRHSYPLVATVAAAVLRYIEVARPKSVHRSVFLTLLRPWRPINGDVVYHVVQERMQRLGITYPRHCGPHALRHACATRLVSQGSSLKEIGDHLGHRSAFATRTYAKVDVTNLRVVADVSLRGVL